MRTGSPVLKITLSGSRSPQPLMAPKADFCAVTGGAKERRDRSRSILGSRRDTATPQPQGKNCEPKSRLLFVITSPTITRPVITSGRDGQHTSKIERMQAIQKALGARIRELRLKRSWSQEEFADVCGIHRSHMGEIDRGETN